MEKKIYKIGDVIKCKPIEKTVFNNLTNDANGINDLIVWLSVKKREIHGKLWERIAVFYPNLGLYESQYDPTKGEITIMGKKQEAT